MRAALFERFRGPIQVQECPDPSPSETGVVIRVLANGICRSDWHGWVGHDSEVCLPHVPGHECVGEIVEVGAKVQRWRRGDRVIVPFSGGCGSCPSCDEGHLQICDRHFQPGFSAWGAFAEFCAIEYADVNLVALPEDMNPVAAASLGCRFMTSYHGLTDRVALQAGETIAIHGCGGVGLSALLIAKGLGAKVIAVDINERTLAQAQDLGADEVINAKESDVLTAVADLSQGGVEVSLDALGSATTAFHSVSCLKKRGRHLQIGLAVGKDANMPVPMSVIIGKELSLFGSHGMPATSYPEMLATLARGQIRVDKLVAQTVNLERGAEVLMAMEDNPPSGIVVIDDFQSS